MERSGIPAREIAEQRCTRSPMPSCLMRASARPAHGSRIVAAGHGSAGRARRARSAPSNARRPWAAWRRPHALTGAHTRIQLMERAGRMFAHAGRTKSSVGLLLFSIENLSDVNREHGHELADEALSTLAARLQSVMRTTDVLARFSARNSHLPLDSCGARQVEPAVLRFLREGLRQADPDGARRDASRHPRRRSLQPAARQLAA